jgi:hypothetical protein
LDNDGDLDVVVNCLNGQALIYQNETRAPRIAVRLKGQAPNTRGVGAKIKIYGGPVTQSQEMMCGGRYVSGDDAMRVFAAGDSTNLTIEVTWRTGRQSRIPGCQPNHVYEIAESGAATAPNDSSKPPAKLPLFRDVSDLLRHKHHEELYDDFARQPLLPRRLSQAGPGVAWFDVDGDGREDLVLSSGKGGELSVYRNDTQQGFQLQKAAAWKGPVERDQTAVLGWTRERGATSLLVGSSNYEDGQTNADSVLRYDFGNGNPKALPGVPGQNGSVGPLALGEIAGDGHMALFVGGGACPGVIQRPGGHGFIDSMSANGHWTWRIAANWSALDSSAERLERSGCGRFSRINFGVRMGSHSCVQEYCGQAPRGHRGIRPR